MTQRATSRPMPGSPALKRSLSFIQSEPQPVLKKTASPDLMSLSACSGAAGAAQIGDRDLLARMHHPALQPGHVDQVAAREERLQLLDAELLEAVGVSISASVKPL